MKKNKKGVKSKDRQREGKIVDSTVYTEESFHICYPEATEEDYFDYLGNSELDIIDTMEEYYPFKITALKRVVLDEEYFDWLQTNKLEEQQENRFKYMRSVDQQDAERIWLKHFKPFYSTISVLPIAFLSTNTLPANNYMLPKESIQALKNLLSTHYKLPKENIFINDDMLRGDYCTEDFLDEVFEERANHFFETKEYPKNYSKPPLIIQNEANVNFRFLPIAIRIEEHALITKEELIWEEHLSDTLPLKAVNNWSFHLKKQMEFSGDIVANNELLLSYEIEDYVLGITEELQNKKTF